MVVGLDDGVLGANVERLQHFILPRGQTRKRCVSNVSDVDTNSQSCLDPLVCGMLALLEGGLDTR